MTHQPTGRNGTRECKPKPAWRQPIPLPSHSITNASERNLRQATFTPHLGRHLDVLVGAITPRHPFRDLLGGARSDDANGSERASHDRHRYSGVTPEELLGQDRKTLSGWVAQERHQYLVAVKPDTGGLLQDRPWRLLAVVPVERSRANHL